MAHHRRRNTRRNKRRNYNYTYENIDEFTKANGNNKNITMSEEDIFTLDLLYTQHITDSFIIISDFLSYISTIESINLVYSRYIDFNQELPNPDIPAVYAAYINFFSILVYANLAFTKYEHLVERLEKGEIDYSLQPNIEINLANIFGVIRYAYALSGILGIYERDLTQPIVGV